MPFFVNSAIAIAALLLPVAFGADCGSQAITDLTDGDTFSNAYLYSARFAMCNNNACQQQGQSCSNGLRVSEQFVASLNANDPNSKYTHCWDAFINLIQQCFDSDVASGNWSLDGETYFLNFTQSPFIPYIFLPDNSVTLQSDYPTPTDPAILTPDFSASASRYQTANPPYTTNGMVCTPIYGDHPVCHSITSASSSSATPVCGNIGNPECTGLHGPTITPGVPLSCNKDCTGAIPDPAWCNANCGGVVLFAPGRNDTKTELYVNNGTTYSLASNTTSFSVPLSTGAARVT